MIWMMKFHSKAAYLAALGILSACTVINKERFVGAYQDFYNTDEALALCAYDNLYRQNPETIDDFLKVTDGGGSWADVSLSDSTALGTAALAGATCRLQKMGEGLKKPKQPTSYRIIQ
jgi:hypothetical protein